MNEYIITGKQLEWLGVPDMFTEQEIVRCRDCTKFNEQEPNGEIGTCNLGLEDLDLLFIVEPNGFCAWGERRSE